MAENWTKLAEAIGMVRGEHGFWHDHPWRNKCADKPVALSLYLMEPAQTVRILALTGLPGHAWLLERHGDEEAEWVACRVEEVEDEDHHIDEDYHNPAGGGTVGEAVARCAAGLL